MSEAATPTEDKHIIKAQAVRIAGLEERVDHLSQENAWLRDKLFGRSSEKRPGSVPDDQPHLFNEAEAIATVTAPEEEIQVEAHSRAKRGRKPIDDKLPRVEIIYDLRDDEKICPHDGAMLKPLGEETAEQIDYVPAKVQVLRHIRRSYACPCCKSFVKTADKPEQILPRSNASPALLAQITASKYVDGAPFYRQEAQFARLGLDLSRTIMAHWMIRIGNEVVVPLINLAIDQLMAGPLIQMDETTVQVLKSGKAPTAQHWMWVRAGGTPGRSIVLFDYDPSRGGDAARRLLDGYHGTLLTDGHGAYDRVGAELGLKHAGCLVHARRYFDEARKQMKEAPQRAEQALDFFARLYQVEKKLRERQAQPDEWLAVRQEKSKAVIDKFKVWLDDMALKLPPSGVMGKAVAYTLGQWEKLIVFLDDPLVPLDNNRAENAIRPFVIGRKAWLFCDTVAGAKASANLYSLAETAKANGVEPWAYFRHIYTHLPAAKTVDDFDALLPWNLKVVLARR